MPPDAPSLPHEVTAALATMPRHFAARQLLTGVVGPLAGIGFEPHVAEAAYLAWVAFRLARHGMLSGRPPWEARETLASRIRSVASRSGSLGEWGLHLFSALRVRQERMTAEDLLWWQGCCRMHGDGGTWRRLRQPDGLQSLVTAACLLDSEGWLWEIRDATQASDTIGETDHV